MTRLARATSLVQLEVLVSALAQLGVEDLQHLLQECDHAVASDKSGMRATGSAMLAAYAYLHGGACRTPALGSEPHELSHAFGVERLEGIGAQHLVLEIDAEENCARRRRASNRKSSA